MIIGGGSFFSLSGLFSLGRSVVAGLTRLRAVLPPLRAEPLPPPPPRGLALRPPPPPRGLDARDVLAFAGLLLALALAFGRGGGEPMPIISRAALQLLRWSLISACGIVAPQAGQLTSFAAILGAHTAMCIGSECAKNILPQCGHGVDGGGICRQRRTACVHDVRLYSLTCGVRGPTLPGAPFLALRIALEPTSTPHHARVWRRTFREKET